MCVVQPVTQANNHFLARRERVEHSRKLFAQHARLGVVLRCFGLFVLQKVAEVTVVLFAHRHFQRNGILAYALYFYYALERQVHFDRELFGCGIAPKLLHKHARSARQLVDCFDHVHGNT